MDKFTRPIIHAFPSYSRREIKVSNVPSGLRTLIRGVDVQVETIFALILGQSGLDVKQVLPPGARHVAQGLRLVGQLGGESLRTSRSVAVGHPDAWPGLRIPRRTEAVDADGRSGVRNAQKHFDESEWIGKRQCEPLNDTVARLDARTG